MIEKLILSAINAALEAGIQIIRIYKSENFNVTSKEDNTPVTIADIKSHEIIIKSLENTALPLLSEEAANIPFSKRNKWDYYWLVDPLDGTKEFIKRNNEFSVNIALMHKNIPVAGIIYSPFYHDLYFSIPEKGTYKINCAAFINDLKYHLSVLPENAIKLHPNTNRTDLTVISSKSHKSTEVKKYVSELKKEWSEVRVISKGSALKFGLIAEGVGDVYPRFGPTMEWDVAAGQAILNELGFSVVDAFSGKPLAYNKPDLKNPWFIAKNSRL